MKWILKGFPFILKLKRKKKCKKLASKSFTFKSVLSVLQNLRGSARRLEKDWYNDNREKLLSLETYTNSFNTTVFG